MATVTYQQRKDRMNELRQAHFHLGFDNDTKTMSDYKEQFKSPKDQLPVKEILDNNQHRFEEYRRNPRKTHYELGTDDVLFTSTAKVSFQPATTEKAHLSEVTKNDLRTHHFVLGFHSVNDPSEYKREFLKQQQEKQNLDKEEQQNQLRKHNHDFGDQNQYYATSYDISHNQPYDREFLKQAITKDQLREQTQEIRQTNIKVGNSNPDYITQNIKTHNSKVPSQDTSYKLVTNFLKTSHTVLGTQDNQNLQSVNKTAYQGVQPNERASVNIEQLKDFRASHFELAAKKDSFPESTQKSHFVQTGQSALSQMREPIKQKANFYFDQALSKNQQMEAFSSVYKESIGKGFNSVKKTELPERKGVYIVLGSDPIDSTHFVSEAQKQFVPFNDFRIEKLNPQVSKEFRQHHYLLGTDSQNYATHNSEYNSVGPRTTLGDSQLKNLKDHHFNLGNAKQNFILHSNEFGSKQGPPNKLDEEKKQDLKMHHFGESGDNHYETSYKNQTQNVKV